MGQAVSVDPSQLRPVRRGCGRSGPGRDLPQRHTGPAALPPRHGAAARGGSGRSPPAGAEFDLGSVVNLCFRAGSGAAGRGPSPPMRRWAAAASLSSPRHPVVVCTARRPARCIRHAFAWHCAEITRAWFADANLAEGRPEAGLPAPAQQPAASGDGGCACAREPCQWSAICCSPFDAGRLQNIAPARGGPTTPAHFLSVSPNSPPLPSRVLAPSRPLMLPPPPLSPHPTHPTPPTHIH